MFGGSRGPICYHIAADLQTRIQHSNMQQEHFRRHDIFKINVASIMHVARLLSIRQVTRENTAEFIGDIDRMVDTLRRTRELPNAAPSKST